MFKTLLSSFKGLIAVGIIGTLALALSVNGICSFSKPATINEETRDCWSQGQSQDGAINQRSGNPGNGSPGGILSGIELPQSSFSASKTTEHCTTSNNGQQNPSSGVSFCNTSVTDWFVAFFTYCLAVLGWVQIRTGEKTVQAIERPWLYVQGVRTAGILANRQTQEPLVVFNLRNPGRTQARIIGCKGGIMAARREIDPAEVTLNEAPIGDAFPLTIAASEVDVKMQAALTPIQDRLAELVNAGEANLVIRCILRYSDAFSGIHETAFCVKYGLKTKAYESFGGPTHNYQT